MPEYIWIILGLIGIGVFVFIILKRKKEKKVEDSWQVSTETRIWRVYNDKDLAKVKTPAGHTVHYEAGVISSNDSIERAVDIGVDRCFTKFECAYPNVDRSLHRIHVVVLRSEPDSQGNPAFRVPIQPGDPYFNSEWDKMKGQSDLYHYILAAGQTVGAGEPYGDVIAIGHASEDQEAFAAQVTEYEMEHVNLTYVDGPKYEETKTHLTGGHPLVPNCPGERPVGLVSRPSYLCGGAKV